MTLLGSHIAVVVLGDIGRSPRMQNHALALADAGASVDLIGLAGTTPLEEIAAHPRIHVTALSDPPLHRDRGGVLVRAGGRLALQAVRLERALLSLVKPDVILVQNPPAVPTLAATMLAARWHAAAWVIDWHNLGAAMVELVTSPGHPAVQLVSAYERFLGRRADAHLCVSRALADNLRTHGGFKAQVVYDRPTARFAPLSAMERASFKHSLLEAIGVSPNEAGLIVSPTSWTADEDFNLLLEALAAVDAFATAQPGFPQLVVVASGQGPGREDFEARVQDRGFKRVAVHTTFLPHDDYARLLAAADLGVCLHRSASGLDLPMKVADMMGAGLPLCALDYGPCLREILPSSHLFANAAALASLLQDVFAGFPAQPARLNQLRQTQSAPCSWEEEWRKQALPTIRSLLRQS